MMLLEQRVRKVAEGTLVHDGIPDGGYNLEILIPGANHPCIIHNVDPAICYSADLFRVLLTAERCEDIFPLPILPFYFTLPRCEHPRQLEHLRDFWVRMHHEYSR